MATLEEMTGKLTALMRYREDSTMDDDSFHDTFQSIIEGEVEDKLEAYAGVIDDMNDDIDAINKRIEKLQARKKSIEKDKEWLLGNIMNLMKATEMKSMKTPFHTFTRKFSGTRQVVVDADVNNLPEWAVRTKVEVNKSAIADFLKDNESCEFAHFDEPKETISIK